MVEHATVNRVVEGSSPSSGANFQAMFYGVITPHTLQTKVASVAQLVEQLTLNQLVVGSNPPRGTIL